MTTAVNMFIILSVFHRMLYEDSLVSQTGWSVPRPSNNPCVVIHNATLAPALLHS